ncbi:hypothetical protein EDB19DRAFT_1833707 [Suillus lakei]|nr:hypothetical protein EDB19DRAFT_1833707 [Suillus lakei]
MPSDTYYPPDGLSNTNRPPITHSQLCISLSGSIITTAEGLTLRKMLQRKQEQVMNPNYRPGKTAMRYLTKIRLSCTIAFAKSGSLSANCPPPACIPLSNSIIATTEALTLHQMVRQRKNEQVMNSNHRPGKTAMRYLTKIRSFCTIAFAKPGSLSANCAPPSYAFLSGALETIMTIHSLSSLTTIDKDTFFTADELIHVSNLPPLASEAVREELYIRGYLKRPDQDNRLLHQPRCIVIPRLLQVLRNRWPKQVATIHVSSRSSQHPSPQAIGRRGGLTVAEALKVQSANTEEDTRTPTPSDQSIYWSCKSPQTALDSSTSPFIQESPLSTAQSCDFCEYSYITSHTTPPSSPELAGLKEKSVLAFLILAMQKVDDLAGNLSQHLDRLFEGGAYLRGVSSWCVPRLRPHLNRLPLAGAGVCGTDGDLHTTATSSCIHSEPLLAGRRRDDIGMQTVGPKDSVSARFKALILAFVFQTLKLMVWVQGNHVRWDSKAA